MNLLKDYQVSRRKFMTGALAGLATAGLPEWFRRDAEASVHESAAGLPSRIGPGDTILIGVIGPGGSKGGFRQGLGDTRGIASKPGVKCIAVCDIDQQHRDEAAAVFGPDTKKYDDFRELLANKDIDAIVCGTPDHWHANVAIAAMNAGKHVYCEKPLTLTVDEGRRISEAQRRTGRIFQTGSQQRSDGRFRMACELVRNGRVGKVQTVHANLPGGPTGGPFQVLTVPGDFNYDMWLGPAPEEDYVKERCHGSFRHWYEYSGGMMTDWGAHHNDIAQWGLGMDENGPIEVESEGKPCQPWGKNCYNATPEFKVTYTYANGTKLISSSSGENGVQFDGENGKWIFVSRGRIGASDDSLLSEALPANATKLYNSNDHHLNFVEGIRNNKPCICTAQIGFSSVTVCHIGNISLRLGGRKLKWDPVRLRFIGDGEANAMLRREPRKMYA